MRFVGGIKIETHFQLVCPTIYLKSMFKMVTDKFIVSTTKNKETSSAKSLVRLKDHLHRSEITVGRRQTLAVHQLQCWTMKIADHLTPLFTF